MAEVSLQMAQLKVNEEFEDWFSLSGLCPPVRDHWGAIRARILFQKELILPFDDYSGLKDLLVSQDLEPIRALEQFSRDRYSVATSLLKICNFCRKECHVMANMVQRTVHEAQDVGRSFCQYIITSILIDPDPVQGQQPHHSDDRSVLEKHLSPLPRDGAPRPHHEGPRVQDQLRAQPLAPERPPGGVSQRRALAGHPGSLRGPHLLESQ